MEAVFDMEVKNSFEADIQVFENDLKLVVILIIFENWSVVRVVYP